GADRTPGENRTNAALRIERQAENPIRETARLLPRVVDRTGRFRRHEQFENADSRSPPPVETGRLSSGVDRPQAHQTAECQARNAAGIAGGGTGGKPQSARVFSVPFVSGDPQTVAGCEKDSL